MWLLFCIFALLIMNFKPPAFVRLWIIRFLFGLMFLSFCRILFISYLFPYLKAAPVSELPLVLISGVLFDIQALSYFLLPFHLISLIPVSEGKKIRENILKITFVTGLGIAILLNFIDLEFYKIKTRRSGIELFNLLSDDSNPVLSYLINYWWLLLLYLLTIYISIRFYPRQKQNDKSKPKTIALYFVLCSGLLFLGARGGWSLRPLRSFDAARFVDPLWVSACINSPTQLITSYSSPVPNELSYMSATEAIVVAKPYKIEKPYFRNGIKPNIVLIILESFGRDYCGFLNREKRFTPFLDSLAAQSLVFPNAYSCGTTSMESMPAIFTSLPSLLEVPYINSNYQNNTLFGVHHFLSKNGYDCSFYYGAKNGSMGFDNFLKISGEIDYYGRNEYSGPASDYDGSWGIWDLPYLQYFNKELESKKQPFFSSVFTLTSHDPYQIPQEFRQIFKGGELPIYKAVQYTDFALRQFFNAASKSKWFKNTVFIITADHPSHSKNEYFYTPTGKYEVPLLIYAPALIKKGSADSITASHTDIKPTIMSLAGISDKFFAFGRNLLNGESGYAINKDYGIAQLINYPYCLRLFPDGKFKMHFQSKQTMNKDIRYQMNEAEKAMQVKLEKELKARLQIYYKSLLDNSSYVK